MRSSLTLPSFVIATSLSNVHKIWAWGALSIASLTLLSCQDEISSPNGPEDPPPGAIEAAVTIEDEPAADVMLELYRRNVTDPLATVTTDSLGSARFDDLDAGAYDVLIVVPSGFELAQNGAARKSVGVSKDQTVELTFTLFVKVPATDIDGNTYETVRILDRIWTAENLRVGHFRNGDPIPEATENDQWARAWGEKAPAWAHFDNDASFGSAYGKLYNNYAVVDSRGLCPEGWSVPTDSQWKDLERFIGIEAAEVDEIGYRGRNSGRLKSTRTEPDAHPRWLKPNTGADNQTGFSALPNGFRVGDAVNNRYQESEFYRMGAEASFWTSTTTTQGADSAPSALRNWARGLDTSTEEIFRDVAEGYGFSVRCIKD